MADHPRLFEFDIRGQVCPSSLLIALNELNARQRDLKDPATRVIILTDNRDATATIPEACRSMGYEADVMKEAQHYRIEIGKPRPGEETPR